MTDVRVGYYPGCSLQGSSRDFAESLHAVAKALSIDLVEIPEWNCCGASSGHMLDHLLSVALPVNVLLKAKKAGLPQVMAPCAACYNRLATASHEIATSPATKAQVESVLQTSIDKLPRVLNVIELLAQVGERIAPKVTKKFEQTVACYYGCLLVRPAKVTGFDRTEDPVEMDKLVAAVGGKTIDWNFKTECCGASFSISRSSVVGRLGARIMQDAVKRQAEAIVVACPMCHSNLDLRRGEINQQLEHKTDIPVLFITQVIGLALGLPKKKLGLGRHFVPVKFPPKPLAPPAVQ
ncbi:MAG TPA: CoB--CoM heterodisulfide reductase iron-sulfur subunit B family protein [Polyangia bacterium]